MSSIPLTDTRSIPDNWKHIGRGSFASVKAQCPGKLMAVFSNGVSFAYCEVSDETEFQSLEQYVVSSAGASLWLDLQYYNAPK